MKDASILIISYAMFQKISIFAVFAPTEAAVPNSTIPLKEMTTMKTGNL